MAQTLQSIEKIHIKTIVFSVQLTYIDNVKFINHSSAEFMIYIYMYAGSEYMAILYHTRNQAAPLQHLCTPNILIRSGDMVDDLDIIEED